MRQAVVDRYVDDIAYTFGVGRDALNVVCEPRPDQAVWFDIFSQVAAAKGLVAGSFSIKRMDDSFIDYSIEPEVGNFPNALIILLIRL
jgi:meiotic recombination protein SPO11